MKVKTLIKFFDIKEDTLREIGDEFVVNKDRYNEILSKGEFIHEVKEKEAKNTKGE